MKELRPKINEVELDLLVEATEKAGYSQGEYFSPEYRLYVRLLALRKGKHKKKRIRRRS